MNITDFRLSSALSIIGSISDSFAIAGVSGSSNSPAGAGKIPVATSSNHFEWRDALSFGSNTNDVSSIGMMGASPSNTRADHVHRGVHLVTAAGSNALYGDVNLVAGTGMALTTAGQSVTVAQDGVTTISHASNTFRGPLTFTTPGDTVGITHPSAGTLAFTATGGGGGAAGQPFRSGTAFPTPAVNDVFFRTDLKILFFYDGTRWLSVDYHREPLTLPLGSPAASYSAGFSLGRWTPWHTTFDLWLEDFWTSTFVATTNDGSKYWTLALKKYQSDYTTNSTVASYATSGDTANVGKTAQTSIGALLTPATNVILQVDVTKTSTPGNLSAPALAIGYRLVGV